MKKSESHFHDIRGLRYHVRTWGDARAPKLFMLHGWMDVAASFQFLVDGLQGNWHVIAPDWRGFGLSGWSRDGYWFPDYYADLETLLDLYQGRTPALVVGHSMGGVISGVFAGIRQDRIARLAILEGLGLKRLPPGAAPDRYAQWLDELADPPRFKPYRSFEEVAERLKRNNPRLSDEKAAFLAPHWAKQLPSGEIVLAADPRHKLVNPYIFRIDEAVACWRRVTARVLIVSGRESGIPARMQDTPEQLAERKSAFRGHRDVELADCGHMMHHDQPQRLAAVLEDFLSGP
jgi:pimeloyl-ACP methyl ester carboxylesterase